MRSVWTSCLLLMGAATVLAAPAQADDALEAEIESLAALEARAYVLYAHQQSLEHRYTKEHPEPQRIAEELAQVQAAGQAVADRLPAAAREEAARRARGIVVVLLEERRDELDTQITSLRERYADGHPRLEELVARQQLARIEIARLRQLGVSGEAPLPPAATKAPAPASSAEGLAALEAELRRLRMRYTDRHPQVKELLERIDGARRAARTPTPAEERAPDPRLEHLDAAEQHLRDAGFGSAADLIREGRRQVEAHGRERAALAGRGPLRGGEAPAGRGAAPRGGGVAPPRRVSYSTSYS